jgi:hypothetical protein
VLGAAHAWVAAVLRVVVAGVHESRWLRCATATGTGAKGSRGRGGTYRRLVVVRAAAPGGRRRGPGGRSWRSSRRRGREDCAGPVDPRRRSARVLRRCFGGQGSPVYAGGEKFPQFELTFDGGVRRKFRRAQGRGGGMMPWRVSRRRGGAAARLVWGSGAAERRLHGGAEALLRRQDGAWTLGLWWRLWCGVRVPRVRRKWLKRAGPGILACVRAGDGSGDRGRDPCGERGTQRP